MARIRNIKADGMSPKFYETVDVVRLEDYTVDQAGVTIAELPKGARAHLVLLDGRAMVTPFGNLMTVPSESLAHGLAGEWRAQEQLIKPALMPLMTLCTTALDIVPRTREKTVNDVLKFLATDTVCFFADPEREPGLRELQEENFRPIIEWFQERFGVQLTSNLNEPEMGILFTQPDEVREAVRAQVARVHDWELSGLDKASGEAKSTTVATMLCAGALSSKEAFEACKTEERYQMERWGDIPHWHGIDMNLSRLNMSSVQFFSACLRDEGLSDLAQTHS